MSRIRCAIYTRKSTDEGLEQEFNSLDAQREACEAFVASQRGLGWVALSAGYDDGGISGGTMDRPALQRLLADVDGGKVDLVVVYKVDRLTRSLFDFAKIIQAFDAKNVSFVSVTQQFNTSTSMGRLTLNVLLSFAQFEREVTAERIRDKVAASKQKGMWMGGPIPLGYDSVDRKLVVNEAEAETIRALYKLYLELGSVRSLKQEADRRGWATKRQVQRNGTIRGGRRFSRGNLYQILHNPIYAGDIAHRGRSYPGLHQGIVDRDLWDAVQRMLDGKAPDRKSATNVRGASVLAGKVLDETGDRLAPTSCTKDGKRHRYYVSSRLLKGGARDGSGWRLPARQLEEAVAHGLAQLLSDPATMTGHFPTLSPHEVQRLVRGAADMAPTLSGDDLPKIYEVLGALLHRVTLRPEGMRIEVKAEELLRRAGGHDVNGADHDDVLIIDVPTELRRRGIESKLVLRVEWPRRAG